MIQNKKTFFIAIFILIVEIFLGIPSAWKMWLIILSGVYLALSSVKIILPSKKSTKVRKPREKVLSVAPIVIIQKLV